MLKPHEVTTVVPVTKGDYRKLVVKRYIVASESTSKAISLIQLEEEEEIVEAHEMVKHKLIMEGE